MANKSKQIGTTGEGRVVSYLKKFNIACERIALHGSKDCGDIKIECIDDSLIILEVKAGKKSQNPGRKLKEEWIKQTKDEQVNSACFYNKKTKGLLVILGFSQKIEDAQVWFGDHTFWYLDDYVKHVLPYVRKI